MKQRLLSLLVAAFLTAGCASDRYHTQRGAVVGAGLGALYGQAIGHDSESTLMGTALGGLLGAMVGNYEDQWMQKQKAQRLQSPAYRMRVREYEYARSGGGTVARQGYQEPAAGGVRGQWVMVPAQNVNGLYVPQHQAWVPLQIQGVEIVR